MASFDVLETRFAALVPGLAVRAVERAPVNPVDPNDKIRSTVKGAPGFVGVDRPISYRVNFENVATASGAVARIRIDDQLDPNLDPRTLRLEEIAFGDVRLQMPPNRAFHQERVQLPPSMGGLLADVSAGVDVGTGLVTWTLQAIDPLTGEPPRSGLMGLLQPENGTGRGQGYVSFRVSVKPTTTTGTIVGNTGTIRFDDEPPIRTNTVTSTVDGGKPASEVQPLPGTSQPAIPVRWSGGEGGREGGGGGESGLAEFDVYVSVDGGAFVPWIVGTSHTEAVFQGRHGSSYGFYSVAHDKAGNFELPPSGPDATTRVGAPPAPELKALKPNGAAPGSGALEVALVGAGFTPATLARWNGQDRPTVYVSSTEMRMALSAKDLASAGAFLVTAFTPGAGSSKQLPFVVGAAKLEMKVSLARVGGEIRANAVLANSGSAPASNISLSAAALGGQGALDKLPRSLGALAPGASLETALRFAATLPPGTRTTLTVTASHDGGTFQTTLRVTIP